MEKDDEKHLYFSTRDELIKVPLQEVIYFEADGNYSSIYFRNGLHAQVLASLTTIENLIKNSFLIARHQSKPVFIRIGRRFIVNIECIFQINIMKQKLVLSDFRSTCSYELNVPKEALKNLKNIYNPKQKQS